MQTHTISNWPEMQVSNLIKRAEELFDCRLGDPGRYVFLQDESLHTDPFTYKTLMLGARGRTHETLLRNSFCWMLEQLHEAAGGGRPVLYWRHPEKIQEELPTRGPNARCYHVRTRIAIPDIKVWPEHLYKKEGDPVSLV